MLKLLLLVLATIAVRADDDHVLVLTSANFSETVKLNDKLVVEFYAPWCGHCKRLAPEYAKAAETLKDEGIILANVDATLDENKELASKYGIRGFPTLKIFRGDEEASTEYSGPRESAGIVTYCKSEFGPATIQLNTTAEVEEIQNPGEDVVILGVFEGEGGEGMKAFSEAAESLRMEAVFRHIVKSDILPSSTRPSAIMFKNFDDKELAYDGIMEKGALMAWIEKHKTPKLVSLDKKPANKKALSAIFGNTEVPKVIGVLPIEHSEISPFQTALIELKEAFSDIHVIYLDPKENPGAIDFFGAKKEDAPMLMVHVPDKGEKYTSGKLTVGAVKSWVEDWKAGKIEKTLKSAEIPETNDGPVKVVVGKTFNDIVLSGKNVFAEFYAPWCGHCKKLDPIWTELGEAFKDNDKVVIAKMDATANDVPDSRFEVKGFPTLMFVNESGEINKYEGGRTIEDLKKFVEEKVGSGDQKDEL